MTKRSTPFFLIALLAATCLGNSYCCAADTVPLRIMTFNAELMNAPGDGTGTGNLQKYRFDIGRKRHIEEVASLIETLNPDVLNLCEVMSKNVVDAIVDVLHEKGLTEYQGYHIESHDTFTGLDVAVITKIKPDSIDGESIRTFYSKESDPTYRRAVHFTGSNGEQVNSTTSLSRNSLYFLTVGGYKLGFLGLHLKSDPEDEAACAKRAGEADIARALVRAEIVPRGYLPIVLGDLNDYDPDVADRDDSRSPKTKVLKDLKDFDPDRPGPELVNAASRIVRKADRFSDHWDRNENGADDPEDVYTMIDHVLVAKELAPYVTHVFICHSVNDEVSDHFPVVVDLKLPPKE